MIDWIRSTWCKSMHSQVMWPMHGKYICPRCLREFPVAWEGPVVAAGYAGVSSHPAPRTVPYPTERGLA